MLAALVVRSTTSNLASPVMSFCNTLSNFVSFENFDDAKLE